jgi:uncharacterized protein YkwD
MFRQTAFGIALTALVLASGLTTVPIPGHNSTNTSTRNKLLSLFSSQAAISTPTFKPTELEKSVFDEINQYRAAKGLPKLTLNANITRQARIHSQNMAQGKTPFSHQGFEGGSKLSLFATTVQRKMWLSIGDIATPPLKLLLVGSKAPDI